MRFATFVSGEERFFGAITDGGAIALNQEFPEHDSLYEVLVIPTTNTEKVPARR